MARSFSKREKEKIRENLLEACKQHWRQYGYKKTSVDELCRQAGISKGAFYLFFDSKEALFCQVLCTVQEEICAEASQVMEEGRGKDGMKEALKLIYRRYDENNFLYHSNSADYTVLMNKLSKEQAKMVEESNEMCRRLFLNSPSMVFKVDTNMAMSVIYSLIMNIRNKDMLPSGHMEVFDFMVEHLIESLYE